jgi:tetratricopeptide (TPR) repeat protein
MMAQRIVDWNLKRYPEGVFFLLAQGRLSLSRSQPARAIACYQKAMNVQSQYRNLHHLSFWEMAISNLALWEIEESLKCWRNLHKESTVCIHPLSLLTPCGPRGPLSYHYERDPT